MEEFLPDDEDLQFEEELLRNPYTVKTWWRYLQQKSDAPSQRRYLLYERALRVLPGSYKLWYAYLQERLNSVRGLRLDHASIEALNRTFERALVTMHKMPVIWLDYLAFLTRQKWITRTRRTFDKALAALPVTQHDRVWKSYLEFLHQPGIPDETCFRVYRRYLKLEPSHAEEYIELLKSKECWNEAAKKLVEVLDDEKFRSVTGKSKHHLWLELSDLMTRHPLEVQDIDVNGILRGGISKFTDEVGRLWTSLADYYIRLGMFERARDIYQEGLETVVTVRDFGLVFDAFTAFEESLINAKMQEEEEEDEQMDEEQDPDGENFLFEDTGNDIDLRISRLEELMIQRPILLSSVMLRQNPHNVHEWHKRVKLFRGNPTKQILTYTEAVRTVSCHQAVGKLHSLWCAFAKFYEYHEDLENARIIFDKATKVEYEYVDDLATVWCEWAEMELRQNQFQLALDVMKRATRAPSFTTFKHLSRDEQMKLPVSDRLYKNLKIWSFYCDLEESLGTVQSTREVYDKILELRIATPQIILNYAHFLQEHKYFEDAFRIYERGIALFKYPHVGDIWQAYIQNFISRYKGTKIERVRDMFDQALEQAPPEFAKPLFLNYAVFEEEYGLAKHAMSIYDKASKTVPVDQRLEVYEVYIDKAAEYFGIGKLREIYQTAIEAQPPEHLSDDHCKTMFMNFAKLEKNLGEIDRARAIYTQASYLANPEKDKEFWDQWNEFEVKHGNEDTFREMRRIRRSVAASFSQQHFNSATVEAIKPSITSGGEETPSGGIAALEKAAEESVPQQVYEKFVRGETIGSSLNKSVEKTAIANPEAMDLDEEDDEEEEEEVHEANLDDAQKEIQVSQKEVPEAVFGGLKRKSQDSSSSPRKKK